MAVADHFEKWKQQKQWQQQNNKLKSKLQEKTAEFDKLSHTCFGYRALIERLDYNLLTIITIRKFNTTLQYLVVLSILFVGVSMYIVSRLEREKHNLEVKIKTLKGTNNIVIDSNRMEMLDLENEKLRVEMEALMSKLQMQQHHSGGLGAAMLQEKLEAQERKIAVLELASKVRKISIIHLYYKHCTIVKNCQLFVLISN